MFARQSRIVFVLLAAYVLTLSIASAHTGADAGFGAAGILSQWSVDYRCPELDLGRYLARSAHANRGFGGRALKRDRARGQQSRPRPGARRARLSTEWIAFQLCDARFAE